MDTLQDIQGWIDVIATQSGALMRHEYGELTAQQTDFAVVMHRNAEGLRQLSSQLNELLASHAFIQAAQAIRTEWKNLLAPIRGYSRVLLDGVTGELTSRQIESVQEIANAIEALRTWVLSNSQE